MRTPHGPVPKGLAVHREGQQANQKSQQRRDRGSREASSATERTSVVCGASTTVPGTEQGLSRHVGVAEGTDEVPVCGTLGRERPLAHPERWARFPEEP